MDDNRTVILYSLDLGDDPNKLWKFSNMTLQDEQGVVIEGHHYNYLVKYYCHHSPNRCKSILDLDTFVPSIGLAVLFLSIPCNLSNRDE